jgi:hypothetical protein
MKPRSIEAAVVWPTWNTRSLKGAIISRHGTNGNAVAESCLSLLYEAAGTSRCVLTARPCPRTGRLTNGLLNKNSAKQMLIISQTFQHRNPFNVVTSWLHLRKQNEATSHFKFNDDNNNNNGNRDSVVGIECDYMLDDRGVGVRVPIRQNCLFSKSSRPIQGPAQLLTQ